MKETEKDDGREEELPHDEPHYRVCPTIYLAWAVIDFSVTPCFPAAAALVLPNSH